VTDFHRLARTIETMLSLSRAGGYDAAITMWHGLSIQEQQNVFGSLAATASHLRLAQAS
jgi:hypothetical protein